MKKIVPFILMSFCFSAKSQTATSIMNGSWTNPLTWNCTCVPINGYTVAINNSVTLNTSLIFNSGGITINNTGSLIQGASLNRDIWINGGYFIDNGNANFRYFLLSAGSMANLGSFTVSAFTNSIAIANQGSITMDSMYVAGNLTNTANAKITGDSLTNAAGFVLTNYGRINSTWTLNNGIFLNNNYHGGYAFTNAGTYASTDSLILTGSIWNKNIFYNNSGAKVRITKNFHNYHPSKTALCSNDGIITILDSWYNTDTVKGQSSGFISCADTSANSGFMKGNLTFCDLTPTTVNVDFNSGSIAGTINFSCAAGIKENELASSNIYPNPSGEIFNIKSDMELNIVITDLTGRIVWEKAIPSGNNEIKLNYPNGVYFVKLSDKQSGKSLTKKLVIQN